MIINEKKDGTKWKRSSLEKDFERIWLKVNPNIHLVVEQTLIPNRRFRCDYLHAPSSTVIEIHGGLYMARSSHKGVGALTDFEKSNILLSMGYVTFNIGTGQITQDNINLLTRIIISRS